MSLNAIIHIKRRNCLNCYIVFWYIVIIDWQVVNPNFKRNLVSLSAIITNGIFHHISIGNNWTTNNTCILNFHIFRRTLMVAFPFLLYFPTNGFVFTCFIRFYVVNKKINIWQCNGLTTGLYNFTSRYTCTQLLFKKSIVLWICLMIFI